MGRGFGEIALGMEPGWVEGEDVVWVGRGRGLHSASPALGPSSLRQAPVQERAGDVPLPLR